MSRPAADGERSTTRKLSPVAPGAKVTWLELFYDLVFAYAFINVTLAASANIAAVLRAFLLIVVLWYLWVAYVTLGNLVRGDEGLMPFATLAGVAATFLAAVVIPDAYGSRPHLADFVFAVCYTVVRTVQVLVICQWMRQHPEATSTLPNVLAPAIINSVLLLAAAALPRFIPGHIVVIHTVLIGLAITVAYGSLVLVRFRDLHRISAHHWADRFGQIVLIALGEPIIALASAKHLSETLPPTLPVVGTAGLGVAVVAVLAFAYFDTRMLAGEQALRWAKGRSQVSMARDAYIFLHLPMILGVIVYSLGLRNVLSAAADPPGGHIADAGLPTAFLLYSGVFVYLTALLAFQVRTGQPVSLLEIVSRPPLILAIPAVALLPALLALALLTAYVVTITIVKHVRGRAPRGRLRAAARAAHRVIEAAEAYEHGQEGDHGPSVPEP